MNDLPRQKLCELIAKYGASLCDHPQRCKSLLNDCCVQYPLELNVLFNALDERVPAALMSWQNTVPSELLIGQIAKWLQDNLGLTEDAARWAVESWALALGVISSNNSASPSPPIVDPQYRVEFVGKRQAPAPSSPPEVEPSPSPVQPTPSPPPPSDNKLPLLIGLNVAAVVTLIFIALNNSSHQTPSGPQTNSSHQTPSGPQTNSSPPPPSGPPPPSSPLQLNQCRVVSPTVGHAIRVFSQPSRYAYTGIRIPKDTKVSLITESNEFVEIRLPDTTQEWVFNDQVQPCTPQTNSSPQTNYSPLQPNQCGVVFPTVGPTVRLFSRPSRYAYTGKRIPQDTRVSLLTESNEFVEIRLPDNSQGWVFNDQIHPCTPPTNSSSPPPSGPLQLNQCGVVLPTVGQTVRLFSQPSRYAYAGKRIPKDTKISLITESNEFVEIRLPDKTQGWVFNDQIQPCTQP